MPASSILRNVFAVPVFLPAGLLIVLLAIGLVRPSSLHAAPPNEPRPALTGIAQVSAGGGHACVLTTLGGLKCWGDNEYGQLGDGGGVARPFPADVPTLRSGVAAVSATGGIHTCALLTTGGLKCWGNNGSGEVGDGSTTMRPTPVDVAGLTSGVAAVYTGDSSTCAVMVSGGLKCWGRIMGNSPTPVDIPATGGRVMQVAIGYDHACLLNEGGGAKCWGSGPQLGSGTIVSSTTPVDVVGLRSGVRAIAAGLEHTCALTADRVKCWGHNTYYRLGDGTEEVRWTPVDVIGAPPAVKSISLGGSHSCALTEAGDVWCWGLHWDGRLGTGNITPVPTAAKVQGLDGPARAISAGGSFNCALTDAGALECWGATWRGQQGTDSADTVVVPTQVSGLDGQIAAIDMQGWHTCVILQNGSVACWGRNANGQLGNGNWDASWTPTPVVELDEPVKQIDAGTAHTCAVTAAGAVKCWGYNGFGQLGNGGWYDTPVPVNVVGLDHGVVAVTAGQLHSCALLATGGVKCWGYGFMLGYGDAPDSPLPMDVPGLERGVAAIGAGEKHTCAFMQDHRVKCWRQTVWDVTGFDAEVSSIAVGGFYNCALLVTGGVQCWDNGWASVLNAGQDPADVPTPGYVPGLESGVLAVTAGNSHTCVLTAAGVQCWGSNAAGQIGDGKFPTEFWEVRPTPVGVVGLRDDTVVSVKAGGVQTCVILADQTLKCWGGNMFGQLGLNPGWTPATVWDTQSLSLPYAAR